MRMMDEQAQDKQERWVYPERLADAGSGLSGHYSLMQLARLRDCIPEQSGRLFYELRFSRQAIGRVYAVVRLSGKICLICERCLQTTDFDIDRETQVLCVRDERQLKALDSQCEPLLMDEGRVSVRQLVEDEALLCLPIVARHDREFCPASQLLAVWESDFSEERKCFQPFSRLTSLLGEARNRSV